MTRSSVNPLTTAARLRAIATTILVSGTAGFVLGVVLHVADHAAAGGWMIGSFAGITFGAGFLAVAREAYFRARLEGTALSPACHDEGG
jgi:heme/copper-type cytochrome/quinol oxidase subunit 3